LVDQNPPSNTLFSLQKILDTDINDRSWLTIAERAISDLRSHVSKEENDIFQKLYSKLNDNQLSLLYNALNGAKSIAPTRPHPMGPTSAPLNWFVGPVVGLFDKLRESFNLEEK
jgi:hypothetical protein